jgi:Calx-beta domain/CHRD domain
MNRNVVLFMAALAVFCLLSLGSLTFRTSASSDNDHHQASASTSQPGDTSSNSSVERSAAAEQRHEGDANLPPRFRDLNIDERTYLDLRERHLNILRGLAPGVTVDPRARVDAVRRLDQRERERSKFARTARPEVAQSWIELGPRPLPNGQTQQFPATAAMSGRATAVVVDPTNSNKIYLGTAQGGVWRSTDGGATWTSIFDTADSLAIGALALAPSSPTTLYVGTGETGARLIGTADVFFGVGLYRIDNADTSATLVGPINPVYATGLSQATTVFTGRGIRKILVHPTDPATVFVCTTAGFSGISGETLGTNIPPNALRGLYRSTNATAAANAVTFQKLLVSDDNSLDNPGTGNTAVWDMALEPGNPNNLLATVAGTFNPGGVFRSSNALAANPVFTQTLSTSSPDGLGMRLAINKVGSVVTVYVSSNEASSDVSCSGAGEEGRVRKSTDGGVNWSAPLPAAEGFCGVQCIYDDPIAVDPNNANLVYLGGSSRGVCADVVKRSADGGTSFTRDDTGLHANAHSIFIDPATGPVTVWVTTDGGVWKRQDAGAGTAWLNQNNAPLGTIQFQSIAVHPTDRNFTIGGTQDNGTEAQQTTPGNWTSAEGGDGGFALIDQSATNTVNVTMYHTFFNLTNTLIGFDRTNLGACLGTKDSWEFRGAGLAADPSAACDGTARAAANGLNSSDTVNFYAPMALGPGTPNTLYFGTDKLYRSTDRGDTMIPVSQTISPGTPISSIGIAAANDNIRLVGTNNGLVFATITGAATLTDISPALPDNPNRDSTPSSLKYISRSVVDPNNPNVAYITLSYYTPAGQAIFKTTNLNDTGSNPVNWSAAGNGIPSIPINAFVIDPSNSNRLFAGTDIGVYVSEDGGANWSPYGSGLPRVAVFDMAIQPTSHTLRVATHGRGMWEIPAGPTFAIDDVSHAEGDAGTTSYTFTVTKTGSTALSSSVNFTTVDGTATIADGDYQANSGTLNFSPTDTSKTITVLVNGDVSVEGDEAFTVHLSAASGATISDADGTGTITNDDALPALTIDDVTHAEGNAGTTTYTFTVTRTGTLAAGSAVNFTTQDGTATIADGDYQANSGTLNFLSGDTTKTITVLVNGDTKFEGNEAFTVHLSGAGGATITDADGTGTITNDDAVPTLAIDDVTHAEGDAGTTAYTFTVTKTGSTALSSSVNFTTVDGTATVADGDYQLNSGTLNFLAGDTTKTITVLVNGDTKFEANEAFTVHLSGAGGATISDADGTGTITNDDAAPTLTIDDVIHDEGNAGTTTYTFTVTKTGTTSLNSSVNFTTQDGTATIADGDYQLNSGTLNFLPTDTSKTIAVLVNGDTKFEANETFAVQLSGALGATLSRTSGAGTISNDDALPAFAINDVTHVEGNAGTTAYTFTVTKTGTTSQSSSVNFATQDGSATIADGDYQSNSGTLNFLAADTSKTVTVLVNGDTKFESNESFIVHLSGASGATISDADGTGTITDDDAAPAFAIDDVTHAEGNAGTTAYTFTVTKTGSTALSSSVNFTTQDGTATIADGDYQLNSGTLNFLPADTSMTITVLVNGDTHLESDETFTVHLSGASGATISDADGAGTITNDDTPVVQFSLSNYNVGEGDKSATVTVTRSGDTSGVATVDFASSDGAATQKEDYEVASGTLTFAAGDTSKTFSVLIVDDGFIEPSEVLHLALSNVVGATLGQAAASITILDNDSVGSISPALTRFAARLDGAQETPPANSPAQGTGLVLLDPTETTAKVGLQFQNLSSAETAAHIHGAAVPGVAAPILFPLPIANPVTNFQIAPTPQNVADLKAGLHYENVHSNIFPNGEIRGQLLWNPTLEERFFVRQQYLDFLSREPDTGGFDFWVGSISPCQADPQCFHNTTIGTADAFFFEPEFQQTAGFVFRAYRASFGDNQPFPNPDGSNTVEANRLVNYANFVVDRARVVGGANLATSQQAFANLFVTRPEFVARYPTSLTGPQFVDALISTIQSADAVDLSSQRQTLIDQFNLGGRGMVLYRLADDNSQSPINNQSFINAEYNRQFALTLYFGYLRRNPEIGGFLFWQGQINGAPVRDVAKQNALVCSFITAAEYQLRFGPNAPRTNGECPQ